jgi:hypothetical protein
VPQHAECDNFESVASYSARQRASVEESNEQELPRPCWSDLDEALAMADENLL